MTDLVERMLDSAKLGNPGWHIPCIRLLREGADEIDRLTTENQELRTMCLWFSDPASTRMGSRAERALMRRVLDGETGGPWNA